MDGAPPLPSPTYESLADFARAKPSSIDEGWMFANFETSWEEALNYDKILDYWG